MAPLLQTDPQSDDQLDTRENRFHPGEIILERFRIVRPIGKDGMGEVYEAEDSLLGTIAIKTIRNHVANPSQAFERFCREVRLSRRFSGPQICRIHELHEVPASGEREPTAILTMEHLDGITLADKVRRDGPFPLHQAISIALEVCEGLRLMHEQHVVHRDLNSENIMLCEQNGVSRVVLIDFGLAREFPGNPVAAAKANPAEATRRPPIPGNPQQPNPKPISPATDIYALGVVLYVLTTGVNPNSATYSEAQYPAKSKHVHSKRAPRPTAPRAIDRIIERCLESSTNESFESASEVAAALRLASPTLANIRRDRPWILWTTSALLAASVIGGAYFLWLARLSYRMSQSPETGPSYRERLAWGLVALLFMLGAWIAFAYLHTAH